MKPLEKKKLVNDIGRELQSRMTFSEIDTYFNLMEFQLIISQVTIVNMFISRRYFRTLMMKLLLKLQMNFK